MSLSDAAAATLVQSWYRYCLQRKAFKRIKRLFEKRTECARELYSTERDYLSDLKCVKEHWLAPLQAKNEKNPGFFPMDILAFFRQFWDSFILLHEEVTKVLTGRMEKWRPTSKVGDVFSKGADYLKLYGAYCNKHAEFGKRLKELRQSSPAYREFEGEVMASKVWRKMNLESWLIMPVQRLMRYGILLKAVLEKTPPDHRDFVLLTEAVQAVEGSVRTVNSSFAPSNRWLAELSRISRELGLGDELAACPSREMVLSGNFTQGRSILRVYLLSDLLVIAEVKGKGEHTTLHHLAVIPLSRLWSRMEKNMTWSLRGNHHAKERPGESVLIVGNAQKVFTFANTTEEITTWLSHIRRIQDENVSALTTEKYAEWNVSELGQLLKQPDAASKISSETLNNYFFIAARLGRAEVLHHLLQFQPSLAYGASENFRGRQATMEALIFGQKEALQFLLAWGADINHHDGQETLLARAIQTRDMEMIQYLLSMGANPSIKTASGKTALHQAIDIDNRALRTKICTALLDELDRHTLALQDCRAFLDADEDGHTILTHPHLKTHKPLLQKLQAFHEEITKQTEEHENSTDPLRLLFLVPDFQIDVGEWRLIRAKLDQVWGQKAFLFRYHLAHTASFHHWANELLVKIDAAVAKYPSRACQVDLLSYSTGSILVRLALQLLNDTSGGADSDAFLLKSPRRPEERTWTCRRVIMLAPAILGVGFNKDKYLDQSSSNLKISPVESVSARVRPTSTFLEHLADGDLFLPMDSQFYRSDRVQLFVIQGTKQSPEYPDGAYRTRGTDGLVPYSASGMKVSKWYLDLDDAPDVVDESELSTNTNSSTSTADCIIRYCPQHDHQSLLEHFFNQRDVFHTVMSFLRTKPSEFEQTRKLADIHTGEWQSTRSLVHRGAALIVFRYTGQQFPVLIPEVVEHSLDVPVQFHQPISRGIKYFHYIDDASLEVLLKGFFGKNNFTGKSFYNLVDFSPVGTYFQAMGARQNKSYSFLIRFEGHPSARVIGSTQWIHGPQGQGFFPHVSNTNALLIDVSPEKSEVNQTSVGTTLNLNVPPDRLIAQVECLPYLSSMIEETGVDGMGQLFSRFMDHSEEELGRLLDVMVGANHAILEARARLVLVQALYPYLRRSVPLAAVFALIVGMPNRQVRLVTKMMEDSSRKGYFTLHSLVYNKLDKTLPTKTAFRFKPAPGTFQETEVNLKDEVLKFFRIIYLNRTSSEPPEWRLLAFARDVLVNKTDPRYPMGALYPGASVCLKAFYKKHQTEMVMFDRSSTFLRGIRKRPGVAVMTKSKTKSYSTLISEYMALYPGASFIFLLSAHHEDLQVTPATEKQPKPLIYRFAAHPAAEETRTSQFILQRSAHMDAMSEEVVDEEEDEEDDDYDELGELEAAAGLVQTFPSLVALAREWTAKEILAEAGLMGVFKDTLVEWRDLIFQEPRQALLQDLQHFESELDQLSGLSRSAMVKSQQMKLRVRRLYPALLLSDEGVEALLALRASQADPVLSPPTLSAATLLQSLPDS